MRRPLLILAAIAALALAAVPAFAANSVRVIPKFGSKIDKAKARSGVPVRLPSRVSVDEDIKPSSVRGAIESVKDGRYHLSLGVGSGCHEATACFVASFFAREGAVPKLKQKVSLAQGIEGRFQPIKCGASCAAAEIQWRQGRVLYDIQFKGTKRQMKALANSAIKAGPR
jgi:hypothetical protein